MKERETKFFQAKYEHMKNQFPRFCGTCGLVWTDELDAILLTDQAEGHFDARNVGDPAKRLYGRIFTINCFCKSTSALDMQFRSKDEEFDYEAEFYKAIGAKAKEEGKRPTKVIEEFRKDYIKWLAINHPSAKYLILGMGVPSLASHFKQHPLPTTVVVDSKNANRIAGNHEDSDYNLVDVNKERISMLVLKQDPTQKENHGRMIKQIRSYDRKHQKHTNILAADNGPNLKYGYNQLDINGYMNLTDWRRIRRTLASYLGLPSH